MKTITAPHLTGAEVIILMRAGHKTIRGLAAAMNITQTRVRQVRAHGVQGLLYVQDWLEACCA